MILILYLITMTFPDAKDLTWIWITVNWLRNLGTMTISCSEEEVADASPFHPRYNTPESQLHDDVISDAVNECYVFNNGDVELGLTPRVATDVRTSRSSFRCRDMEAIKEPTIVEMTSTEPVTSRAKCVEFETWPCGRLVIPIKVNSQVDS